MGQLQAAGLLAFPCRSAVTGTSVTRLKVTSLPADKCMPEKASLSKRQSLDIIQVIRQYRASNPVSFCQAGCLLPLTFNLPQRLPAKMGQLSSRTSEPSNIF